MSFLGAISDVTSSFDDIDIMEYRLVDSIPISKTLPDVERRTHQAKRTVLPKRIIYLKRKTPSRSKSRKRSKVVRHSKRGKSKQVSGRKRTTIGVTGDQWLTSGMVTKKSSGALWNEFYPWLKVPQRASRRKNITLVSTDGLQNHDLPAIRRHLGPNNSSSVPAKKPKQVFFFKPKEKKNTTNDVKNNATMLDNSTTSDNQNLTQSNDTSFFMHHKNLTSISLENPKPVFLNSSFKSNHTATHSNITSASAAIMNSNQNKTKQDYEAALFQKVAQMPLHLSSNTARYHPHLLMYVPPPLPFTTIQEHRLFPSIYPGSEKRNSTIGGTSSRKFIDLRNTPLETQDISSYMNVTSGRPIFSSINEAYENEKVSEIDPDSIPESTSNIYPNDTIADLPLVQPSSSSPVVSQINKTNNSTKTTSTSPAPHNNKSAAINIKKANTSSAAAVLTRIANNSKSVTSLDYSIKNVHRDGKVTETTLTQKISGVAPFYPTKDETANQRLANCSSLRYGGADSRVLIENNCASFISVKKDTSQRYKEKDGGGSISDVGDSILETSSLENNNTDLDAAAGGNATSSQSEDSNENNNFSRNSTGLTEILNSKLDESKRGDEKKPDISRTETSNSEESTKEGDNSSQQSEPTAPLVKTDHVSSAATPSNTSNTIKSTLDNVIYLDTAPSPPDSATTNTESSDTTNKTFSALPDTNTSYSVPISSLVPSFGNSTVGKASFLESDVEVAGNKAKDDFPKTVPTYNNISTSASAFSGETDVEISNLPAAADKQLEKSGKSGRFLDASSGGVDEEAKLSDKDLVKSTEEKGKNDKESAKIDDESEKSADQENPTISDQESAKISDKESEKSADQISEKISDKEFAKATDTDADKSSSDEKSLKIEESAKVNDADVATAMDNDAAAEEITNNEASEKVNDEGTASHDTNDILTEPGLLSTSAIPSNATESISDTPLRSKAKLMKYPTFENGSFLDTDVEIGETEHTAKSLPIMTNITVPFIDDTTSGGGGDHLKSSHSTEVKASDKSAANQKDRKETVEMMNRMARLMLPGSESESVHRVKSWKDTLGLNKVKASTPKMVKKNKETQKLSNSTKIHTKTSNATIVEKLSAGNKSAAVQPLKKKEKKKIEKKVKDYEAESDKKKKTGSTAQSPGSELKGVFSIASLTHMKGLKDENEMINKKLEQFENATLTPEQKSAKIATHDVNVARNASVLADSGDMSVTKTNFERHAAKRVQAYSADD